MNLTIDNFDGAGPRDYTAAMDAARLPEITRKLNQITELRFSVVTNGAGFVVPVSGGRVSLVKQNGQTLFTGYVMAAPSSEYLGWNAPGAAYRYDVVAQSDEVLLNEKLALMASEFVARSAGSALEQMTQDLMPGGFTTSGVQLLDTIPAYAPDAQRTWSQHAAEIALQARASYTAANGAISLAGVGANGYELQESDASFSPQGLKLQPVNALVNDVMVIGEMEPQAYVSDYFVGDGVTTKFYLSQTPFVKKSTTVFDEEFTTAQLDPARWAVVDPSKAITVSGGSLQVAGGTGADGATTVAFVEKVELGGAVVIEHGDVQFNAASSGVIGGLYAGAIAAGGCLAGFQIAANGTGANIQGLVSGAATGTALSTVAGHHYVMTTRLYAAELYRMQQVFHSSLHPAGSGYGGAAVEADVRVVLEVQDIDPNDPATEVAAATVLYDGLIAGAPGFCTYALVNAISMQCSIELTDLMQAVDAEVRTALPGESYVTELVGTLSAGGQCEITSSGELEFYSAYVPAANQQIEAHYRGSGRAIAEVSNPASIAAQQRGLDNGVRAAVRHVKLPAARTSVDCENAALAILDDAIGQAWMGEYETWSDFLPGGAADVFPGDALNVNMPSRAAAFTAVVREVGISVRDLAGEHSIYQITFANDAAKALGISFESGKVALPVNPVAQTVAQVGTMYLAALTGAVVTQVTSTTISVDAGIAPPAGGGIEVRWSDEGWGVGSDRNLAGRFTSEGFTLPRLTRVQTYYLQQYDSAQPPRYSRFSAALHVDYPL